MRTVAVPPYLLPADGAVSAETWRTIDGVEIGERLDHWDPFTDIELIRAVTVDVDAVREACRLAQDSALALTATWRSDRTRLAGDGGSVELGRLDGRVQAPVGMVIPGAVAGGRLYLSIRLVLRSPGTAPSPISPRRPGAVLWTDVERVALEGGAARFPVTPADFVSLPRLPDAGLWALDWDVEELRSPVLGSLRLLVNSADSRLLEALRSGSDDARAGVVRSFVIFDVARSLVDGALGSDRFVDEPEVYEEGTVGRMLFDLLAACWPGVPVRALRSRSIEDPARLEAELQAHLGLFA